MYLVLLLALPAVAQESAPPAGLPPAPQPQLASAQPPGPALSWVQTVPKPTYSPLTNRQKLAVFVQYTYSPLTFLSTAFDAAIAQAASDHEDYGQGMQGYGKRFGAGLADNESGVFFVRYLLPTIFHQDPRYFRRRELPRFHRAAYAASRVLVTRSDSGHTVVNLSYLGGNLLSTSLSNVYYPFHERSFGDTMVRWGGGIGSDAGLLILHEFWPDIKARLSRNHVYQKVEGSKMGQSVEHKVDEMNRKMQPQAPNPPPQAPGSQPQTPGPQPQAPGPPAAAPQPSAQQSPAPSQPQEHTQSQ